MKVNAPYIDPVTDLWESGEERKEDIVLFIYFNKQKKIQNNDMYSTKVSVV